MKTLKIAVHSLVDVITNSSTVIYVQVHDKTVKFMKEFIDYFLKKSGSKKTADQLFEFKMEMDPDLKSDRISDIMDEEDCTEARALQILEEKLKDGDFTDCNGYDKRQLVLVPKDGSKDTLNATEWVQKIFEVDANRDG